MANSIICKQIKETLKKKRKKKESVLESHLFSFQLFWVLGSVLEKMMMTEDFSLNYCPFVCWQTKPVRPLRILRWHRMSVCAAVPEWVAAAAFGVVTVFTILLRNAPQLQLALLWYSWPHSEPFSVSEIGQCAGHRIWEITRLANVQTSHRTAFPMGFFFSIWPLCAHLLVGRISGMGALY